MSEKNSGAGLLAWLIPACICLCALAGCSNPGQAPPAAASETGSGEQAGAARRPNILLIVADDLGYTDLGVYGGEIGTPNLDALARQGVMFTNFYSAPTCSPTRAMLLSGTDNHVAGLGNMFEDVAPNQEGRPGYEGHLSFRVASLAELLRDGGYHTYMTGKWHLGLEEATGPAARGFEKSFAMLQGGAGHFDMLPIVGPGKARYREDGKLLDSLPEDFYSTRFFAERLMEYIEQGRGDGRPFFGYLAFTAPHWPLQAPEESIARYAGKYDAGYDVLHARRLSRLKALGLVAEDVQGFPRLPREPAWEDLSAEQQKREARMMEIYAAMVSDLDRYVGKVVDYLKAIGEFDNTVIFFMSDNGAEGHHLEKGWAELARWVDECCDNSYENMGRPDSYLWYGPNWGRVSVGPWRMFKGFTTEGGIKVPAFIRSPELAGGRINHGVLTVMDVMPTLLELAGVEHPGTHYRGREVVPMQGSSMLSMLRGTTDSTHGPDYVMGWELFGKRAIRKGDWKIVQEPEGDLWSERNPLKDPYRWRLFNLTEDPAELNDVSAAYPEKLKELVAHWEEYARRNGVIIPDHVTGY